MSLFPSSIFYVTHKDGGLTIFLSSLEMKIAEEKDYKALMCDPAYWVKLCMSV